MCPPLLIAGPALAGEMQGIVLVGEGKYSQIPLANFSASSRLEKALKRAPFIVFTAWRASFLSVNTCALSTGKTQHSSISFCFFYNYNKTTVAENSSLQLNSENFSLKCFDWGRRAISMYLCCNIITSRSHSLKRVSLLCFHPL